MKTYIAGYDVVGSEMERPFDLRFVEGETEAEALAAAEAKADHDEKVRGVEPLQPILDRIAAEVASGRRYLISWKDEGPFGPVWITDAEALAAAVPAREDGVRIDSRPYGAAYPPYETNLPWMSRAQAKRLAKYLGLVLDES